MNNILQVKNLTLFLCKSIFQTNSILSLTRLQNVQHIIECGQIVDTSLTVFFKANQQTGPTGNLARSLTYQDFPDHFTLHSDENNHQSKVWRPRQRNTFALGQMTYVGPTVGENFYL